MRVLVVGSGGREHALVWALSRAPGTEVLAAPGNPGMAEQARLLDVGVGDRSGLVRAAVEQEVDLVVVGPEAPLVAGIADEMAANGVTCLGPGSSGAALEGSKWFAKLLMREAGVRCAEGRIFESSGEAMSFIGSRAADWVIKADGLAAGKGVFLPATRDEALEILQRLESGALGDCGRRFIVERRLPGREVSVIALCSGTSAIVMPPSRDHKRVGDGDTGPNTGGMGAVSPPPGLPAGFSLMVLETVFLPVLEVLEGRGIDYRGALYAGLIVDADAVPSVLEFNVRLGDPETQAVLPLADGGEFLEACYRAARGEPLEESGVVRAGQCSACIVVASRGYPGSYGKGFEISGLDDLSDPDLLVFHAGTALDEHQRLVTAGGRVLCVTGLGETLEEALETAYGGVGRIGFEGMIFRKDIGRTQ
ncbi:phosphoribosylamine--glycine ligase [Candidatus Fermentibacterales bacterium]|nr:phosphoribosylamine--glycine ligase [Candidatus Fermentibacterales bacterium]